jgi:DNA-binding NarL/FixJ family response regulator
MGPGRGTTVLLIDDTPNVTELFAVTIANEFDVDVVSESNADAVDLRLVKQISPDLAIVDLSFPRQPANGIDVLLTLHRASPSTALVVLTQGDDHVADLLRDAWELFPLAAAVSKTAPLKRQLELIGDALNGERRLLDPTLRLMVPDEIRPWRTIERYSLLVPHLGHAKLWAALMAAHDGPTYSEIASSAGLRTNSVKNYRANLLGELALHGLHDPGIKEMQRFARRSRGLLAPHMAVKGIAAPPLSSPP